MKLLIADDSEDILEFLDYNFSKFGYDVYTACNGIEAIDKVNSINPDLLLMDIMMPELDGLQACKMLRKSIFSDISIVLMTAYGNEELMLKGLDIGADSYVLKPISFKILLLKIEAIYNRKKRRPLQLDSISKRFLNKSLIELQQIFTKTEYTILMCLLNNPEKVFSREEIYNHVWGDEVVVNHRTLDVHIRKIREKLDCNYIKTKNGIGYSFH